MWVSSHLDSWASAGGQCHILLLTLPHTAALQHTAALLDSRTLLRALPYTTKRTAAYCYSLPCARTTAHSRVHYRILPHCHTYMHYRTAIHYQAHCQTLPCALDALPCALPLTTKHCRTCALPHKAARPDTHYRTLPHCRTAAHCRVHCHT